MLLPYHCIYVTDDPIFSKSSEEQMFMEDKLTYTGVVQRTEPSAPSPISLSLSCLCTIRPFYVTALPRRGEGDWRHRSWTFSTYTFADSRLFLPPYPSFSITVAWNENLEHLLFYFFSFFHEPHMKWSAIKFRQEWRFAQQSHVGLG